MTYERSGFVLAALVLFTAGGCLLVDRLEEDRLDADAIAAPGCAPTDDPALMLFISSRLPETCEAFRKVQVFDEPHIHLQVYGTRAMQSGSVHVIGDEVDPGPGYGRGGAGRRCESAGECDRVTTGTLRFLGQREDGRVDYEVELELDDGSTLSAAVVAAFCQIETLCG